MLILLKKTVHLKYSKKLSKIFIDYKFFLTANQNLNLELEETEISDLKIVALSLTT